MKLLSEIDFIIFFISEIRLNQYICIIIENMYHIIIRNNNIIITTLLVFTKKKKKNVFFGYLSGS